MGAYRCKPDRTLGQAPDHFRVVPGLGQQDHALQIGLESVGRQGYVDGGQITGGDSLLEHLFKRGHATLEHPFDFLSDNLILGAQLDCQVAKVTTSHLSGGLGQ